MVDREVFMKGSNVYGMEGVGGRRKVYLLMVALIKLAFVRGIDSH